MTFSNLIRRVPALRLGLIPGVCCFALLISLSGCKDQKTTTKPAKKGTSQTATGTSGSSSQTKSDCNNYIDNAMSMLEPERLGISSFVGRAVGLLNQWASNCGNFDTDKPTLTDSQKPFFKKYLGEAQLAKMDLIRFTESDAKFVRDSQLFNGMINAAIEGKANDVERITAAFYYCMGNVALVTNEQNVLPLSPYEICILGAGSAEQRAWIYIDMLRQLRLDAVLLKPAKEAPFKLLIGVLLNDDIYLFDPTLGLPIPAKDQPADAILIPNPATLADVLKSPEILKDFYGEDAANRFSAEELKTPQAIIIGRSCEWSTRMRRLEDSLSRKQTFVLFRNLEELKGDPGFIAHLQTIGKGILKEAEIKVSEYPDKQVDASESVTGDLAKRISSIKLPFRAPVPYDVKLRKETPEGFVVPWGAPSRKLLKTRTAQLLGDQTEAISSYVTTRLEAGFPSDLVVPQETRLMHLMAAQQATYFLAIGQYLQGNYSSASQTFNDYFRLYSRVDPERTVAAIYLMAICDAQSGKLSSAIVAVGENKPPEALKPVFPYLEQRWRAIRENASKK
ncbi:tetratricopeptide repeat protein [Gimesia sp.]|uniref:tetratricopeptide repeat protein n=1 Tax=Gimesia sp. TaxID=2024833 RepID=UPI003A8D72F6